MITHGKTWKICLPLQTRLQWFHDFKVIMAVQLLHFLKTFSLANKKFQVLCVLIWTSRHCLKSCQHLSPPCTHSTSPNFSLHVEFCQKSKAGPTNCSAGSSRRSGKKRNREEISRSSGRSSRLKMTSGATSSGSGLCQIGIFPVNNLYFASIPEMILCKLVLSFLRFQPRGGSGP